MYLKLDQINLAAILKCYLIPTQCPVDKQTQNTSTNLIYL